MKTRFFFFAAVAVIFASCVQKPSDVTKLSGMVNDPDVTEIRVRCADIDTTLAVADGKFMIELPADITSYCIVQDASGKYGEYFISDGTSIQMTFADESIEVVTKPEYVESALYAYQNAHYDIYEAEAETMMADLENLAFETVKANPDNAVALMAMLDAMYELEPEKMLELLDLLQEPIRSHQFTVSRRQEAQAQLNTKPGQMFSDFTVNTVSGYTRSMDPQPIYKEVKFSDYVGKGTYVLVDFWAPWCGPCRREIPNIKKVYEKYMDKGLEVLSIAVWERKPQSHTIETAAELGMDWLHINNGQSIPTDIYGIGGIPHLMLIGPDGTILKRGFHGLDGIEAAVAEFIK